MSALPDYEQKDHYSESDMNHIIARRMAAIQLEQLQTAQFELRREMLKEVAEIKVSVSELVLAWNTAGTFVSFVKYIAAAITAITVVLITIKGYMR